MVDVEPAHLDRPFDYAVPAGVEVAVGQRVRVVFAGRRRTGWVVDVRAETEVDPQTVRHLSLIQGNLRWFDADDLRLFRWVADRYAASLADVLRHALPQRVAAVERQAASWTEPLPTAPAERPPCAHKGWRPYRASALLRASAVPVTPSPPPAFWWRPLPGGDVAQLVTDLVARCLSACRTALVLAPDPASPVLDAVLALAGRDGADLRATRSDRARYRAFLRCRGGHARVAVGERAAAFAPLRDLGLVVVTDEASPAYKERRSPRHHAREVALAKARMEHATALLVGEVPSAQLWRLLTDGHVRAVAADRDTERRRSPRVDVVDLSGTRRVRFANVAHRAVTAAVRGGGAVVVLAARGGVGAALACRRCGLRRACPVCDGSIRPSRDTGHWECPSCGWAGAGFPCPACGGERMAPLAAGAGWLAAELARTHPGADVARMEGFDAPGPERRPAIGVMTRGSVVCRPAWLGSSPADVVVVPDADAMLGRPAFDAGEDALRLWMAVARWTTHVVVQTATPRHPAIQALVRWDPEGFWHREAARRAQLGYPPARSLVRFAASQEEALDLTASLREHLPPGDDVLGPDLDGGTLVKTADVRGTLAALTPLRHAWARADRKVRIDVDPVTY